MRRPAWAETAAFANCWSHLEMVGKLGDPFAEQWLRAMSVSRVIKIEREQIDALPLDLDVLKEDEEGRKFLDYRVLRERWLGIRNPFPVTFLDLSEAQIPMFLNETVATAALVIDPSELSRFDLEPSSPPEAPMLLPFLHFPEGRPGEPIGIGLFPDPGGEGVTGLDLADWEASGEARFRKALEDGVALAERAVTCLAWLMSFNVELVEAPLSPRQRKRELAKGREIALTVRVRQGKRSAGSEPSGKQAGYSHRFETRGHFRHHFEQKPDGSPSKTFAACLRTNPSRLVEINGKPCFRFWVPPFVKGPADKPFVPKIRIAGEQEADGGFERDDPRG